MSNKSFVLHDESVNSYGFRMLASGANLAEFRKNPIMLLNHNDWDLPIGRWENIRVEGGRILADPVFDEADARAKEVKRKVDEGFVRMSSIGAWPPEETSDAYELKLPGQTLPTVTKWTVREASIVTIGANHNALAFYDGNNKLINLHDASSLIKLMDSNNQSKITKMSLITGVLKLQDTANEPEIVSAIQAIIKNSDRVNEENVVLKAAIDKVNADKRESQKLEGISLADAAIKDGRYDAKGRESLLKLFDQDFEGTKAMLASIPVRAVVASQINNGGGMPTSGVNLADVNSKSWDELDREGLLVELRDNAPEVYNAKFKERFGIDPGQK